MTLNGARRAGMSTLARPAARTRPNSIDIHALRSPTAIGVNDQPRASSLFRWRSGSISQYRPASSVNRTFIRATPCSATGIGVLNPNLPPPARMRGPGHLVPARGTHQLACLRSHANVDEFGHCLRPPAEILHWIRLDAAHDISDRPA